MSRRGPGGAWGVWAKGPKTDGMLPFGSFLQDEWELISRLIKVIHENFEVPVTAKMRIFEDIQKTVDYAKMMESAGCQILTVHGRTREQKGALTGLASWNHIKAVVEALKIPVIANGNVGFMFCYYILTYT